MKYGVDYIKTDEYLYVNGARHGSLQSGFRALKGDIIFTKVPAMPLANSAAQQSRNSSVVAMGAAFGLVGALAAGALSETAIKREMIDQVHHFFNSKTVTRPLCKGFIEVMLRDYPRLHSEFESAENKDDVEVLKAFLQTQFLA